MYVCTPVRHDDEYTAESDDDVTTTQSCVWCVWSLV